MRLTGPTPTREQGGSYTESVTLQCSRFAPDMSYMAARNIGRAELAQSEEKK